MKEYAGLIKLVLGALLLIAAIWGVRIVLGWKEAAAVNAANVEQANRTGTATVETVDALGAATQEAQRVDIVVHQQATQARRQYEELRNEDQAVRAYTDTPVPTGLREQARARRESRERLGSSAAGNPSADRAASPEQ